MEQPVRVIVARTWRWLNRIENRIVMIINYSYTPVLDKRTNTQHTQSELEQAVTLRSKLLYSKEVDALL